MRATWQPKHGLLLNVVRDKCWMEYKKKNDTTRITTFIVKLET